MVGVNSSWGSGFSQVFWVCKGLRGFPNIMVSFWELVTLGYGCANG